MSRPLRIEYAGAVNHVTTRGNGGAEIFADGADRKLFLATLSAVVERFGWVIHAYCLMAYHSHLVVETPEPNLGRGMRQLSGVYGNSAGYTPSASTAGTGGGVTSSKGATRRSWSRRKPIFWSCCVTLC